MLAILADVGVRAVARRSKGCKGDGGGEAPGNQAKKHCHAIGITRIGQKYSADTKYPSDLVNATSFGTDLQRLPHAKPVHEALPDLNGVAAGRAGARLVVDAHADQCRAIINERLLDQPLKILLIRCPAAVGKPA